jgi:hypothetical protein
MYPNLPSQPEIMCDLCVSDIRLIRFARGAALVLLKEQRRKALTLVRSSWGVQVTQNVDLPRTHNKMIIQPKQATNYYDYIGLLP